MRPFNTSFEEVQRKRIDVTNSNNLQWLMICLTVHLLFQLGRNSTLSWRFRCVNPKIVNILFCHVFLFCLSANKPKIHYSRSHPKPSSTSPSIKASPNTPSPSRPSLSRQSSASSKRMSTRLMFGEEHCYVIDAKAYGNCGRYLNVSAFPFQLVGLVLKAMKLNQSLFFVLTA